MKQRQFWELVLIKVRLNLKSEASRSYLSYVWWILEPALFVAVFYLVFGVLLGRGGPGFVAFLVCGKIPFLWFSRSVMNSSGSLISGKRLISQVYIPKLFFPMVVLLQDFVKQLFVFLLLLIFLILYDSTYISTSWLYLPMIVVTQILFVTAGGLIAASIVPLVPDFRFIISTGLILLMFGSGIFYSYIDIIQPRYQELFLANPMAALIKNYRQVLLDGSAPDFGRLIIISLVCGFIAIVMSYILRRYSDDYSRRVIQY